MPLRRRIVSLWRNLFKKDRIEQELTEEVEAYLELLIETKRREGLSPAAARRAALIELGGVEQVKESVREVRVGQVLETVWQDLRYGVRVLRKNPGFTLIAVMTLALGIGANTALFSVVDAVLIRTLPVAEPEQLVVFSWRAGLPFRISSMSGISDVPEVPGMRGLSLFRYEVFDKMRQASAAQADSPLSDLFAMAPLHELAAMVGDQAETINGQIVSGNYYGVLGIQPFLGREINDEDDKAGAAPVVVLSHQFWRERFNANPAVIGQTLKLNKQTFTIIGVTPPAFTSTLQVGYYPAVTVPLACEPLLHSERSLLGSAKESNGWWWLDVMGRLKPGATYEQARDSLDGPFQAIALELMPPPRRANDPAQLEPKDYPRLIAESGSRGLLDKRRVYSATIYGLFVVVALVLVIACANVANLLLARSALRGAEISVRLAVGAGRWRLIRQLLTESVLLGALGGAVGVFFAFWGKSALLALTDEDTGILPPGIDLRLNWRVLGFTLAISLLTGMLFGLAPAWRATKMDLVTSLKQGRRTTGAVSRLSKGLIIAQVGLSMLLLVGAGLFIRTLSNLQQVNLGFNQENLLLFRLQPQQTGYKDERLAQFYQQLFARLDNLPGVSAATFARVPLISYYNYTSDVFLPGESEQIAEGHDTDMQMARENYFATMEIPLLRGRGFTAQDDERAPHVCIVNQSFAQKYFPDADALGQHVKMTGRDIEIIGVVADSKYSSQRQEIAPLLCTTWRQNIEVVGVMYFALRTASEPTALAGAVREAVRELDSNLPVTEVSTQTARAQATLGSERLSARLLSFFGGLALLLAAIGLSGVLAYSVAQRTNEIGIRMALGAQPSNVLRLVIWQGMKLVLLGLVAGAVGGYALKRLLASQYFANTDWQRQMADQLYGVKGTDPVTFVIIALVLTLVALVACWLPARRATKVDPMTALRVE